MTVALAPPICGDDVPPVLINKCIQKFITILVDKSTSFLTQFRKWMFEQERFHWKLLLPFLTTLLQILELS